MDKKQFWAGHFVRREALGITRKAYCAQEGLSVFQWHYWEKKAKASSTTLTTDRGKVTEAFVAARVEPGLQGLGCELLYPSGVRVRCEGFPPPMWLRQVV